MWKVIRENSHEYLVSSFVFSLSQCIQLVSGNFAKSNIYSTHLSDVYSIQWSRKSHLTYRKTCFSVLLHLQIMTSIENDTSLISNHTDNSVNWLLQSSIWSLRIVCPIFIILCPISNWACIRIFQARVYARSSSKWYFISIAIFDTIYVLVTATLLFLITLNIYILNWNALLCKSIVFFNYLSCQISAGLLVCLSIDRLIATSCLSVYRHTCTTQLSRIVCLVVILMFSVLNCHYLIGYNIDSKGFCNVKRYRWYEENYTRLNIVYLLSYSIIPFTMITICNFLIVLSVCQNKTNMKKKYDMKKPIFPPTHVQTIETSPSKNGLGQTCDQLSPFESPDPIDEQSKYEMLVSIKGEQVINTLVDYNCKLSFFFYPSPRQTFDLVWSVLR